MKYFLKNICLLFLFFALFSCNKTNTTFKTNVSDFNRIDSALLDSAIQICLSAIPDTIFPEFTQLKHLYSSDNYHPKWLVNQTNFKQIDTLMSYLLRIEEHGILKEKFDIDKISEMLDRMKKNDINYLELGTLDIHLSIAYLNYCNALVYGIIRPRQTLPNYYFETLRPDSVFVSNCFEKKTVHLNNFLKEIQPSFDDYISLQSERVIHKKLIDSIFTPIPTLPDKQLIKQGIKHSSIPLIARRLMITGEIPFDADVETKFQTFDSIVLKPLNKFRTKNNLYPDNEIGNKTIKALNFTFAQYVDKIDINLERMRWKPRKSLGNKYIRVNVADMSLKAFRNDSIALYSKVCVGKMPDNRTPFLQSAIHEVILNPKWQIPTSIIIKETSKIAAGDSTYLRKHSIKIFKNGSEITSKDVDWTKISKNYQPYRLIQDPGSRNALGRVKFNFANKFSVYLHDTNAKSAFRRHNRALSHGCVRVQKPLELAFFCLPDFESNQLAQKDLMKDKIRNSVGIAVQSKKAKELIEANVESLKIGSIHLQPRIPILIDYFTCFKALNGSVVFRDDLYDLDKYIIENLKNTNHPKIEHYID